MMIGALRTVLKGLVRTLEVLEIGGRITAFLRSARILGWVLETRGDSASCERPSAYAGMKTCNKWNINNE